MFFFNKNINANDKRTLHEFSFNDVDGKTYLLSQHKNKVVLLVKLNYNIFPVAVPCTKVCSK